MGKNDFLNLLVTQLKNQDPLQPMDAREMVSQLAQFSALEQMQNLNQQTTNSRQENAVMQSAGLVGQNMRIQLASGIEVEGTVERVKWENDSMALQLGGQTYAARDVTAISAVPAEK